MVGFFLLCYLILLTPKFLWDRLKKGKKHPGLFQRLGFHLPPSPSQEMVIWIHAISVGEIKAAQPLFKELKKKYPDAFFLITCVTATGLAEAERSFSEANAILFHPIDFKWVVRRWLRCFHPSTYLLIETDFWPNLLSALKERGSKVILASGKISERSTRRLSFVPFFAKKLFSHFDLLLLQNEEYKKRFLRFSIPENIYVTGNLKLDLNPQKIDSSFIKEKLSFSNPVITISCTHDPEEEMLLDILKEEPLTIFLAPRHPERFDEVAKLLLKRKIPFIRFSEIGSIGQAPSVILVDAMGKLPICYSLSRLTIVGGSFIERVGGHNVLEPCFYGTPVLFGPYMHSQKEFASRVLEAQAGRQETLEELPKALKTILFDEEMKRAAGSLLENCRGATSNTISFL